METVDNPAMLFRQIDATAIEEPSYSFHIDESDMKDLDSDSETLEEKTVEFTPLPTDDDEFEAAHEVIQEDAVRVDSVDDVPPNCDTKFEADEDGRLATYYCDTSQMGYELVRQEDPKRGAYTTIFSGNLFRVEK